MVACCVIDGADVSCHVAGHVAGGICYCIYSSLVTQERAFKEKLSIKKDLQVEYR